MFKDKNTNNTIKSDESDCKRLFAKCLETPFVTDVLTAIGKVVEQVGPGLKEIIYHESLVQELALGGVHASKEPCLQPTYKQQIRRVKTSLYPDIVVHSASVDSEIIVELKVSTTGHHTSASIHQLRQYLNVSGLSMGILINICHSLEEIPVCLISRNGEDGWMMFGVTIFLRPELMKKHRVAWVVPKM